MLTEIVLGFFMLWQMEASAAYWQQFQDQLPDRDYPYTDEVVCQTEHELIWIKEQ